MIVFDTNVLLRNNGLEELMEEYPDSQIGIAIEMLAELDNIKMKGTYRTASPKEKELAYNARCAIRALKTNINRMKFLIHEDTTILNRTNMIVDDIILEHCKVATEPILLITNDFNMAIKAQAFGIRTKEFHGVKKEPIASITEIQMTVKEHQKFLEEMSHKKINDIPVGQFVNIVGGFGEQFGTYRYLGPDMWDPVNTNKKIKNYIYDVEPKDINQACAIKSLKEDDFTVITGPAGSGKTLLSLGESLERMSKVGSVIHIFVNPVKTRDTAELGYYPGSRDEKLMSSFVGGILSSKFGDVIEVERLMSQGGLKIYPFSDIRGIEINSGDIMYITEAQNLSIDLIKLAIQRCAEGAKLIIEGDADTQVDRCQFEGSNNGLQRVIDVFTGTSACDFGYINLPNIYRSRMADKAEEL